MEGTLNRFLLKGLTLVIALLLLSGCGSVRLPENPSPAVGDSSRESTEAVAEEPAAPIEEVEKVVEDAAEPAAKTVAELAAEPTEEPVAIAEPTATFTVQPTAEPTIELAATFTVQPTVEPPTAVPPTVEPPTAVPAQQAANPPSGGVSVDYTLVGNTGRPQLVFTYADW